LLLHILPLLVSSLSLLPTHYHPSSSFFFNDTATTEIYTLSLHDALPISPASSAPVLQTPKATSSTLYFDSLTVNAGNGGLGVCRSEERFSRNAETDLVCRLLLEKKKEDER